MAKFSRKSKGILETCCTPIQLVMNEAIKYYDFSVVFGHREVDFQFDLYKKGRAIKKGKWEIVDKNSVVTYCDGHIKKSKHNYHKALAIDIIPYPTKWSNINEFYRMSGVILTIAQKNRVPLIWGGDWKTFKDYPHFEMK